MTFEDVAKVVMFAGIGAIVGLVAGWLYSYFTEL